MFFYILILIVALVTCCLHVLGATFDSGGTFEETYDNSHGDYQNMPYFFVIFAANFRTAISDL